MESIELRTESREVRGKKVKRLRASGWIPAVMYGPDTPARPIQIEERALYQTMQQAGSTALIALYVDKESSSNMVLARDIQRDILTSQILHVDFYQVRMTEKVKTTPRLVIVGKSPLVNAGGAVMIQAMTEGGYATGSERFGLGWLLVIISSLTPLAVYVSNQAYILLVDTVSRILGINLAPPVEQAPEGEAAG